MAKKFLVPIDLNGLELLNASAQKLATAPSHAEARFYYDTTLGQLGVSNGTVWTYLAPASADHIHDIVSDMVAGNTETGISVTEVGGKLNFVVDVADLDSAGIVRLATVAEAGTGTAEDVAVTPAGLASGLATKADATHSHGAGDLPNASTTARGVIELATYAETQTGTDNERGVTPAALKSVTDGLAAASHSHGAGDLPTASTEGPGVVELATVDEVTGGTDSTRAVTAAGVKAVADTKANVSHAHTASDITDFTTAVDARVGLVVDGAPGALDTLNELAAALGDDANFAATVNNSLSTKATKFAATLATSSTGYAVTHGLNTRDVIVGVYTLTGAYEEVEVDVEHTDANTVTLRFAVAPAANSYRVVVHG